MNLRNHIHLALGYFITAAFLGLLLRSFQIFEFPFNYKFIVHGHSHIALLGWVYVGLTTLLFKLFLVQEGLNREYRRIFWFTQITLVGMLVTFPFQGYAFFSIVFSTLFLIASYWFTWFFVKNVPVGLKRASSYQCIRFSLIYMVLSSIGPWLLGIIMNTLGPGSVWYRLAIYFYLHFQYNGWMVLALMGLFFYVLEQRNISIPKKMFTTFFWSMNLGIVFTFFLSTLWTNPPVIMFAMGGLGAFFQIIAFGILIGVGLKSDKKLIEVFSPFQKNVFLMATIFIGIKILLQLMTAFPYFSNLAATIIDFTIGYLHWTFLGVVSISLFLFFDYFKLLKLPVIGYFIYLLGFITTEVFIFYKGVMIWQRWPLFEDYNRALALVSLLIPMGLIAILGFNLRIKKNEI